MVRKSAALIANKNSIVVMYVCMYVCMYIPVCISTALESMYKHTYKTDVIMHTTRQWHT